MAPMSSQTLIVDRRVHAEDLREIEEGVARGMPGLAGASRTPPSAATR